MTESLYEDQGYWVSPFEELTQQEDALLDETQAPGAAPRQTDPMTGIPGGDASTFESAPVETGGMLASWYGPGFHGSPTASGEPFDPYGFTAAHPYLPFGTQLDVGYGGNAVRVTVNDRGPFSGERELDLSEGAAQALGLTQAGVDYVQVSYPGGGAAPVAPAAQAPSAPPSAYDPSAPIYLGGEVFAPEGEFGNPYDDDLDA